MPDVTGRCAQCGAAFVSQRGTRKVFCSPKCGCDHYNGLRARERKVLQSKTHYVCIHCGGPRRPPSRSYCSVYCRDRHQLGSEFQTFDCAQCGTPWTRRRALGHPARCPECASKTGRGGGLFRRVGLGVLDRDGWQCQLCWRPIDPLCRMPQPGAPTVDHIVPVSEGGTDALDNLRAAHFDCNRKRGAGTFNICSALPLSMLAASSSPDPLLERDSAIVSMVLESELSFRAIAMLFNLRDPGSVTHALKRRGLNVDARARRWRIARGTHLAA